ncbi:hypothetical protein Bbelb_050410 [Branchiostoma belcheri]|nr:hypothetical protein Bbelb_050410 [Branchiostoma belcheri]
MKAVYKVLEAMENGKMPTDKDVIHDEQRSKKSYGIPVRILPCRVVKDAQLRTLKDELQRAMEEIGMVVVVEVPQDNRESSGGLHQSNKFFKHILKCRKKMFGRIESYSSYIIRARLLFEKTLKVKDVNITDGDQMPLHRNDTAGQKTLTMKDCPTYVKLHPV